jgi:hypothetical protein
VGLKVERQGVFGDSQAKLLDASQSSPAVIAQVFIYVKGSAGDLGAIHGDVRTAEQLVTAVGVLGRKGDADAGADVQARHLEHEGLLESCDNALRDGFGVVDIGVLEHDTELVTPEPGKNIGASQNALET